MPMTKPRHTTLGRYRTGLSSVDLTVSVHPTLQYGSVNSCGGCVKKFGMTVTAVGALGASVSAHALDWNVEKKTDPFTDTPMCRVNYGSEFGRSFVEGIMGWYAVSYFFAERRGSQIIAGITNDRKLPVAGDIQIRVDDGPVTTITPADTPESLLPPMSIPVTPSGYPSVDEQIARSMHVARAQMLPYRVLEGERAKALLRSIVSGRRAIWRSVTMIAAADSGPAEIKIEGLKEALQECGIDLSPSPTPQPVPPAVVAPATH
jgi:hypothetical protein